MEEKKYCIYMHVNKINGKKYIGQTCQKVRERWNNGKGYKTGSTAIYNAIQKYGWDNFEHIIIAENLTREEADKKEVELIAEYNTTDRDKGYNIASGGHSLSEEDRKRITKSLTGRPVSEETRKKISDANKGANSVNFGVPLSEEEKENLRNKVKCKPVVCVETGVIYRSAREAGRLINVSATCIIMCCNKRKQKTVYGYHWEYVEDDIDFQLQPFINVNNIDNIEELHKQMSTQRQKIKKEIICINNMKIYDSCLSAEKDTGIHNSNINACVRHVIKVAKGLKWFYLEEWNNYSDTEKQHIIDKYINF